MNEHRSDRLGRAAGAGAGVPDRGDNFLEDGPVDGVQEKVRHLVGGGTGGCGHPLDHDRGHTATTAVGLLQTLDADGPEGVCHPCVLLAAERLDATHPGLVPEWARNATTLLARLKGAWPPPADA